MIEYCNAADRLFYFNGEDARRKKKKKKFIKTEQHIECKCTFSWGPAILNPVPGTGTRGWLLGGLAVFLGFTDK